VRTPSSVQQTAAILPPPSTVKGYHVVHIAAVIPWDAAGALVCGSYRTPVWFESVEIGSALLTVAGFDGCIDNVTASLEIGRDTFGNPPPTVHLRLDVGKRDRLWSGFAYYRGEDRWSTSVGLRSYASKS
jgi:hypothetical protein